MGRAPDGVGQTEIHWKPQSRVTSCSLLVGLIAVQKVFLEISKEQAVMEFLCFYICLDVDFSDFQQKASNGEWENLPLPTIYPNGRNAVGETAVRGDGQKSLEG